MKVIVIKAPWQVVSILCHYKIILMAFDVVGMDSVCVVNDVNDVVVVTAGVGFAVVTGTSLSSSSFDGNL